MKNEIMKILVALRVEQYRTDYWRELSGMLQDIVMMMTAALEVSDMSPPTGLDCAMSRVSKMLDSYDPEGARVTAEKSLNGEIQ